jgi:hypothetical protein
MKMKITQPTNHTITKKEKKKEEERGLHFLQQDKLWVWAVSLSAKLKVKHDE